MFWKKQKKKIYVFRIFPLSYTVHHFQSVCFEAFLNDHSRFEQKYFIKYLVAEKYKQYEIYRRLCDVCGGIRFSKKEIVTYALSVGSPLRSWIEKQSI